MRIIRIFSKFNVMRRAPAIFIALRSVMPAGRVDVCVPQYIGNQINVTRFLIEIGAESRAQLMRRDRLQRRNDGSIFLDQLLYRTDIHPALLRRQEQCVFMPGQGCYCAAPIHIFAQHIRNFIRKIKNDALAAFSGNKEAVCLKIHILNV